MNTYLTISALLNFLAVTVQIGVILSLMEKNPVRDRYLIFLLPLAGWSGAYTLWRLADTQQSAEFYCQILIAFASVEPVAFFHFCLALSGIRAPLWVAVGYGISLFLILAIPEGLIVEEVSPLLEHDFWPRAGQLMPVYLLHFTGYLIASVWILVRGWKANIGGRASDHMLVLFSAMIGFIGGATNFPLWYEIPIQPYGNILVSVYLFLMLHGIYKKRIFGLSVDFYKVAVGFILNLSVALFFLLFYGLYLNRSNQPMELIDFWLWGVVAFLASAVTFWVVPRIKFFTERVIEGALRKERDTPLSELAEFSAELADIAGEDTMFEETAKHFSSALRVSWVAVFRLDAFGKEYSCRMVSGRRDADGELQNSLIGVPSPLIDSMLAHPQCVVLDQVFTDLNEDYYKELVRFKKSFGLSMVVPIHVSNELPGLILMGAREDPIPLSQEELSALYNFGAQLGVNLRARDFERRSSEVDKLVALGTMAAGLSHEIRNPLVSVQTLAGLVQSGKSLEQLSDSFKQVLMRDVKRIESIVDGVAAFSKNQKGTQTPNDIRAVVQSSADIYRPIADAAGIRIILPKVAYRILVSSNYDQLVQVFNNLIENAIHAVEAQDDGEVSIEIVARKSRLTGSERWVEISVRDNGEGVPSSIRNRIFDPFITSKDTGSRTEKQGMGLGLAISKRIIENHGGAISVQNMPEGGAKFIVALKIFDSKEKRDG